MSTLNDAKNDVKDAANEVKHRTIAEAEHAKREVLGNDMTAGEKVKSGLNEAKNRAQAELDKIKREVRHEK
jgi:hypothetical protein